MKTYTLGQLAWVSTVGCFYIDAYKNMLELGIDENIAFCLTSSDSFRCGDLIGFFRDYGEKYGFAIEKYIDFVLASYPENWPHN